MSHTPGASQAFSSLVACKDEDMQGIFRHADRRSSQRLDRVPC